MENNMSAPKSRIEEIESEIRTRQRVLASIKDQTSIHPDEIALQLEARDSQLELLNAEIAELKVNAKPSAEPANEKKLKETLDSLANASKEKADVQGLLQTVENKYREDRENWYAEKETLLTLQEELTNQNESLNHSITAKDQQIEEIKKDMQDLSAIINQMSSLNKELNQKIETQNQNIQELNAKYYEEKMKGENVEGVQKQLESALKNSQESERKTIETNNMISQISLTYDSFIANMQEAGADLEDIIKQLQNTN